MESPVVVDKPPEYHGSNERGFPFDEEESGAWSSLAARHPDIAARLRQRPATWARKRRPSGQDAPDAEDFGDEFEGFDRFPFDNIPPEFREHFPTHFNRRYSREEPQPSSPRPQQSPQPQQTTVTAGTQTDHPPEPAQSQQIPQYGLRNTVDLGQKSAADVDADERGQRSMSAPPDTRTGNHSTSRMSHNHQEPPPAEQPHSNVRHIPIFVEGRDEPVINKSADPGAHFTDSKPAYAPPPQPHINREQYFGDDDTVGFHHAPNFSRAFGTPFGKGFRQGPQPFVQQKVYPQTAFTRGASPQRSQSPKPQQEEYVKVHHEQPRQQPQQKQPPQQRQQQPQHPQHPQQQQQAQHPQQQQQAQHPHPQPTQQQQPQPQEPPQDQPKPKPQTPSNDPIAQILSIQTDVLNLMTEVENFTGSKKDKRYMFLDEMLTRNLIKLDNIETDGKENIRQARKEAIRCIQKCIAVLEAKAEKGSQALAETGDQPHDVDMKENSEQTTVEQPQEATANGEVEMKDTTKEEIKPENQEQTQTEQPKAEVEMKDQTVIEEQKVETKQEVIDNKDIAQPAPDTRLESKEKTPQPEEQDKKDADKSPKKGGKNVKKRDKSASKGDSNKEESNTISAVVDDKETKTEAMEVDGAASQ